MQITDDELVRGCSRGDEKVRKALYDRYAGRMFGVCLRYTSNKEEAEDILQEAMLKVFQSISTFRGYGLLESWIKKVVVNTALDHYRQMRSRGGGEELELNDNSGFVQPLEEFNAKELLSIIRQLPGGYRAVFNLFAIEGFSHKEISEMLNISEGTSKSQYARARTLLIKMLELYNNRAVENNQEFDISKIISAV